MIADRLLTGKVISKMDNLENGKYKKNPEYGKLPTFCYRVI
jgi:hypothetical protein